MDACNVVISIIFNGTFGLVNLFRISCVNSIHLNIGYTSLISGEAEKEYWRLLRSSQEKRYRDFKGGNRGRFAL